MIEIYFCKICGTVIPKENYRRRPRYCSWSCYQIDHKAKQVRVKCAFCGTGFLRPAQKSERKKYCSNQCCYAARLRIGAEYVGSNGYVYIKVAAKKYELKHRLVMEQILGRKLKGTESVHHKNGKRTDNRADNLILFGSNSAHVKYHNDLFNGTHPKDSPASIKKRVASRKRNQERAYAGTEVHYSSI